MDRHRARTQQVRTRNPRRFRRLHSLVALHGGKGVRRRGGRGRLWEWHKGSLSLSLCLSLNFCLNQFQLRWRCARAWPSAYNVTSARAIWLEITVGWIIAGNCVPFPDCSNYPGLGNYRGEGLECCLICDLATRGSSITSEELGRDGTKGGDRENVRWEGRAGGEELYLSRESLAASRLT